MSATLAGPYGAVNEGTVTFTVKNGATPLATLAVTGLPTTGATATYVLPAGTASASYTIQVVFNGSSNYNSETTSAVLNVRKATPTITWSNPADITFGTAPWRSGASYPALPTMISAGLLYVIVGVAFRTLMATLPVAVL